MSTRRLLRGNVVDISTRDAEAALVLWPAARARAVCFYGGEVVGERCVAEIQGAGRDYGVAEALAEELRISRSTVDGRGKEIRTAVRVGQTQSNMSAPRATDTRRSSG